MAKTERGGLYSEVTARIIAELEEGALAVGTAVGCGEVPVHDAEECYFRAQLLASTC